ncbi:molybdenum cofactor guanylyltransferase [Bacillus salitolerans]|uniref:Probable molybdenum cofactor guanylyltransferase n=1 Tax=Bacillus salitolerans TaxID=1437434 RepID=A0ABW4LVC0_9BACI
MNEKICGVILAGGESRRFGSPKAFALYEGKPFWRHSYHALRDVTSSQIIVSHPSLKVEFEQTTNLPVILDEETIRGKGPLAGIFSAMNSIEAEWYITLSCDVPKITSSIIETLLSYISSDFQATIPVIHGKMQPLIAVYHRSVFPLIKELLDNDIYRMTALLNQIDTLYLSEKDLKVDGIYFENINDKESLKDLVEKDNS